MPFKARNSDYKLKVRMREDLASRKFNETSCENNGLLVTYGSEYIIELFKVNGHINGSDFLEGRNFINIDLIRRMDVYGEIEKIENLYSFEGVSSISSDKIYLKFGTLYAVGEGSNDIEIGLDFPGENRSDFCKMLGVMSIKITNPLR